MGTKAPQAAGKIHTDFEKGFIMAEIMKYDDFKEAGSENAVKVGPCLSWYFFAQYDKREDLIAVKTHVKRKLFWQELFFVTQPL